MSGNGQPHPTFDTTTAAGLEGFKKSWNDWFDDRFDKILTAVMRRDGWLCDVIGKALARERKLMRAHVKGEIETLMREHVKSELETLRRELTELRNQIKAQRARDPTMPLQ